MLKTKIQKDNYVHIVTSKQWITHEKMEKFILIVCPSTLMQILQITLFYEFHAYFVFSLAQQI